MKKTCITKKLCYFDLRFDRSYDDDKFTAFNNQTSDHEVKKFDIYDAQNVIDG